MGSAKLPVARAVSAGGVVLRSRAGELEVLLCGRREPPQWSLPKGAPDPSENLEQAALREVREETGVEVAIVQKMGAINYWFVRPQEGFRYHKRVHYYLMEPTGGDPANHDYEFDAVAWFPYEEAFLLMTYKNEREMVARAVALLRAAEEERVGAS